MISALSINALDIPMAPCTFALPVTVKLPDIIAEPVNGNAAPPPLFKANDAVEANELLNA